MHKYGLPISQVLGWPSWNFAVQRICFNITINSFTTSKAQLSNKTIKLRGGSPVFSFQLLPCCSCWMLLFSLLLFLASAPLSLPMLSCTQFGSLLSISELWCLFHQPPWFLFLVKMLLPSYQQQLHYFLPQLLEISYSASAGTSFIGVSL